MSAMMTLAVTVMVVGFASVCVAAALWSAAADKAEKKNANSVGFFGLAAFFCGLGVILVSLPGSALAVDDEQQVPVDGPGVVQQEHDAPQITV